MDRLLLVDGSNLLFQMFFGMPARIVNEQGKAIQGTMGFVGALLKIIRMTQPTHIAVLFDGEHSNERTEINADYKANRIDYSQVSEEDTPFSQLPDVYAALDYLGICHTETSNCETDDWIAGYALTWGNQMEIVISSFDSDFFQLLTDHVSILRYRGDKTVLLTPEALKAKYSILPSQYADFKSLTGDPADNIKGAEKIGPKTAASLLNQFGSLKSILQNANAIAKPSIKNSILLHTERVKQNYQLIKLNNTTPLPFEIDELVYHLNNLTTTDVLKAIHLK